MKKDVLDKNTIQSLLKNKHSLKVLDTIDSTNDYLKLNFNKYDIVVANKQTSGKGRRNRKFFSPKDTGIYMSILVKPNFSIEETLKLTALTSVVVHKAIKDLYNIDIKIKWVNDLILNDLKLGGILCESQIYKDNINMIIGIGINVKKISFPDDLKDIATSIENNTDKIISRNELIASIINHFDNHINKKLSFIDTYKKQSNTLNKEITVYQNNTSFKGKAIDIDNNGNLIVLSNNKQIILNSGEITIR
jgi:BirA family biotin operon repressor/biotin-[acetyl-CoA-carboxylase] ligase